MCGDVSNQKPILDKAACEAAATSMGLDDVEATETSSSFLPPGCFWRSYSNSLYYNPVSTSIESCDNSYSKFCLCIAAPDCIQTNGGTSNAAPCLCGGTGCTAASGLFCYAEISQCSTTIFSNLCPIRDGSAANSVACTCGSVECTTSTGLICFSTYGGGSCRKTGLGAFGYIKEEGNKMCGSESNRKPILDKALCEAAATSMDLDDVEADDAPYGPPGCYSDDGKDF